MEFIIYAWIFIIGAIMGSFLGCMGYRIPNKIKTTYPSSFCSSCKKTLKWYMNIPIVSYILLHGKCHYCKKKIGLIYFLCELLCASLYLTSYLLFGFTIQFFISVVLVSILITTIVSDFLYYYISDRVLIIGSIFIIGILFIFMEPSDVFTRIFSAVALFLVMIGIKILGNSMFKRESLGDGDIKLMAVIGLSLGLFDSFISLFFSSFIALMYSLITLKKNKSGIIPFGPFLLIGALIIIYLSNIITPFIYDLFSI